MPHPKMKSENYEQFGGLNQKASAYLTGPREMLQLFNLDFSVPGDLTGRPGSTQYYGQTLSGSIITGVFEFANLSGSSHIAVTHPTGFWLGSGLTLTGVSLGNLATTQTLKWSAPSIQIQVKGTTFGNSYWDMVAFVDNMFVCDGRSFLRYNGSSFYMYSLPLVAGVNTGDPHFGETGNITALGMTPGVYSYKFAYMNNRGFIGNAISQVDCTVGASQIVAFNPTFMFTGFGITAIVMYRSYGQSTVSANYLQHSVFPVGTTAWVDGSAANIGDVNADQSPPNNYIQPWVGYSTRMGVIHVSGDDYYYDWMQNAPSFLEVFKNQLFMGGFSNTPSELWFSDIGEPEGIEADWSFEFRTDDGDRVTAMKSYLNRLVVWKELSMHELVGDDPENFTTREVSTEYGCLNNRCVAVWHNMCWFLDRKGIGQYSGGLPEIVSTKIESVFQRMNLSAAKTTAQMIFMKNRNEVWTLIPVDGSSVNNLLVIYDIVTQAWAFWDGPQISVLAKMIAREGVETSFSGDYLGRINVFGTSLMGDNGSGFTSLIKGRYESPEGQSTEKMFRRLFVNADSLVGNATLAIETRLRANYGASYQVAASLILTRFQNYENFGISAKSLSVEISHFSAVDSMRLHGYALEYRWQRDT